MSTHSASATPFSDPTRHSWFALPERLARKADPALTAADDAHFAVVDRALTAAIERAGQELAAAQRETARDGHAALERDQRVHRLAARLRTLRRYGVDLCLGRMVPADGGEPVYVGRLGLGDGAGGRLLVDWRSPAAAPFFAATPAAPSGLASRRRYRWTDGRVTDFWDERFGTDDDAGTASLDDRSAFVASLGAARTEQMRDVLGTLAADQDAVIRADASGVLVVDGGPGTGKTVVALHRAAYLLHADPLLSGRRGGVLVVGPSRPYLDYVADVLPSLGEDDVRLCVVTDLVPEGRTAGEETDPEVARLKEAGAWTQAVDAAVAFSEQPPQHATVVSTPWGDVRLRATDWADAFAAVEPGVSHHEGRELVWEELVSVVGDRLDADVEPDLVRRALAADRDLRAEFAAAWPVLHPGEVVGDLWSVPAYLRHCAPWLTREQVARLQRADPQAWTTADLPLLDAARRRLGDPGLSARRRQAEAVLARQEREMSRVVDDLVAADDSELQVMTMLRGADLRGALVDRAEVRAADPDALAGPFAHVVVDEAQELTDAQWQMLLARCPSRSLTVVGDRAQARRGFGETWTERLRRVGPARVTVASLRVNYRTPAEVMAVAEPVIRAVLPDANVPVPVRSTGVPVRDGRVDELDAVVTGWLAAHDDGIACVIGRPSFAPRPRVRVLSPVTAKGLEFDLVVLVDPAAFGPGLQGGVDRYVAMTRATGELVVLEPRPS